MNKYISTIISIIILIGYGWIYVWVGYLTSLNPVLFKGQVLIFVLVVSLIIMIVVGLFINQSVSIAELTKRYLRINVLFVMSFIGLLFDLLIYTIAFIDHHDLIFVGTIWVIYTLFLGTFIGLLFPLVGIEGETITGGLSAAVLLMKQARYQVYPGTFFVILFDVIGYWIRHGPVLQGIGYLSFPVIWLIYYGWMRDKIKNKVRYI